MEKHYEIMSDLQTLAKDSLMLAGKFSRPDYAQYVLEAYKSPRKSSGDRADIQQMVCDIKTSLDAVLRDMEKAGFDDLLARYNDNE